MSAGLPAPPVPVTTVAGVIARMEAIEAALPATDGLACFNRMYLQVTRQINSRLGQGFFADPAFMTYLDVAFAGLYFGAADAAGGPAAVPLAWRPLLEQRTNTGIEPVQFALAGMNAPHQPRPAAGAGGYLHRAGHLTGCGRAFRRLPEGGPVAGRR